jgi:hypothetical protein
MPKTIAAILLAVTLTGAMASSAVAQPYGYHHHWRHWHHWHRHCGWRHGHRWCR